MQFKKQDIFSIPNILTYIRFICLPFYLWLMFGSLTKENATQFIYIVVGLVIFVFAEITDIVDGHIARKYNMITDIGKVIDPIADKLIQCFAILTLAIVTMKTSTQFKWATWVFAGVLIVKEVFMGVSSRYFMVKSKYQIEQMANRVGKNGAVFNFVELCLIFLFNIVDRLTQDWAWPVKWLQVISLVLSYIVMVWAMFCCVWQIYAGYNYTRIYGSRLKALRESGELERLDAKGNPIAQDEKEENK